MYYLLSGKIVTRICKIVLVFLFLIVYIVTITDNRNRRNDKQCSSRTRNKCGV